MEAVLAQAGLAAVAAFVGEMGDKSQLVVIAMAARGRPAGVLAGAMAAAALLAFVAATLGGLLVAAVPRAVAAVASAAVFLAAAVLMAPWRPRQAGPPDSLPPPGHSGTGRGAVGGAMGAAVGAFLAFAAAEMGDKTQVGLAALATSGDAAATAVGGALGMALNLALAVAIGARLARRLPVRTVRWVAASLFAAGALLALLSAVFPASAAFPA